jgi:hypothetical protein
MRRSSDGQREEQLIGYGNIGGGSDDEQLTIAVDSGSVDPAEPSSPTHLSRPGVRPGESREITLCLRDPSKGTQRLDARRQAFFRKCAARKTPLVLAERPQGLVRVAGVQLLLRFRQETNLFGK